MIYSHRNERLWAVYQTDHAEVCGSMAQAWGRPPFRRPVRLDAVIRGAAKHDEGWRQWEERPKISEDGTPLGFLQLPVTEHLTLHRRGVRQVLSEDEAAGVLVSMHASGLYRGRYGLEAERRYDPRFEPYRQAISVFLVEQERLQKSLARKLDWPLWQRLEAYLLLQFWDRLSLLICMHSSRGPIQMNGVPCNAGDLDATGGVRQVVLSAPGDALSLTTITVWLEDGVVYLDPYPFVEAFQVELPVRRLDRFVFGSDEELAEALAGAATDTLSIRFEGTV